MGYQLIHFLLTRAVGWTNLINKAWQATDAKIVMRQNSWDNVRTGLVNSDTMPIGSVVPNVGNMFHSKDCEQLAMLFLADREKELFLRSQCKFLDILETRVSNVIAHAPPCLIKEVKTRRSPDCTSTQTTRATLMLCNRSSLSASYRDLTQREYQQC